MKHEYHEGPKAGEKFQKRARADFQARKVEVPKKRPKKPEPDESVERAQKAFETFDALRELNSPLSVGEFLALRDRGRR